MAAFQSNSFSSVTIPANVTNIGDIAFTSCTNLTDVTSYATEPPTITSSTFYFESLYYYGASSNDSGKTLHVLPGCKAKYEVAEGWKYFTIVEDADAGLAGITSTRNDSTGNRRIYNISGQKIFAPTKGINIINGKKYLK